MLGCVEETQARWREKRKQKKSAGQDLPAHFKMIRIGRINSAMAIMRGVTSSILRWAGQYQQNLESSSLSASCLSVYHSGVMYSASNIRSQIFRCLSLLSGIARADFTRSFWPRLNFFNIVSLLSKSRDFLPLACHAGKKCSQAGRVSKQVITCLLYTSRCV